MSKFYTNKVNLNRQISKLILLSVLIFSSFNSYSQLIVPFTPRTSSVTPARTVYTVKGDFSMIGNTNLTSAIYSDNSANNNAMIYVDIDNDDDTWNSSSSTFIMPSENGSIPECSNIIYAGLYWTGSAVGSGSEQYEFTATKDGETRTFDKRNILFRPPNATDYIEVTATDNDIYYPQPGQFSNIYSAYAEVTDLIDPTDFLGEYFVADLPSLEGILPPAGYHGGWGMVVVYENSLMDWRDITVFDGHAHVSGEIADYTFDVNGFNTAQSGDVDVKLGIMAAEGDVNINGDYFEIQRQDNSAFQRLSHSTNTTDNFFNSSINTGGNPRDLNRQNNTGIDIAMFNIDNTGNGIITNNQTSTRFRYGTTSDRFVIFNVTFAVNSYVPEVTGVITNTSINGNPNPTPVIIEPGQSALYELEIKNIGTEATNNTVVTIPLPDTVNPSNLNILFNTFYTPLSADYSDPQYDGSIGSNGAIVWNLGTLPLPTDIDDVLAEISFELTASTSCSVLGDVNDTPSITLFGNISGVGAISNVSFNTPLIQGFSEDDICKDNPIPIPIVIPIDHINFINQGPTITCPADISQNIDSGVAGAIVNYTEPVGTDNAPGAITTRIAGPASGDLFPIGTTTVTYQVEDDCGITATCNFTVTITDDEDPTITCPSNIAQNVDTGADNAVVTYMLPTFSDNVPGATINQTEGLASGANFPIGTTTNTFVVTDANGNTATCSFTVTVTDDEAPTITCPPVVNITADAGQNGAIVTFADPVISDNAPGATFTQTAGLPSGSLFPIGTTTNTFVVTDANGNTATCSFTVTVTDDEAPTITCPGNISQNVDSGLCSAVVNYAEPIITDNSPSATISQTVGLPSGSIFPVGTTTNTFVVTDANGNTATCSFTVSVTDNEPPVIVCPTDISQAADSAQCASIITIVDPTASDNCSIVFAFTGIRSDNLALTDAFPVGTTTITWTATDEANNTSLPCIQTINITDDEAPTFVETLPVDLVVECDQVPVAQVLTATDNCNTANVTFNEVRTDGSCVSNYILERTWIATDDNGNTTTHIQTITVEDNTPPVLSLPANQTAECSDDLTPIAFGEATATDNCDASPEITFTDATMSGACSGTFTITRTWTATDACGNISTADQIISTSDTTAPEFVEDLPQNLTIECNSVPAPETITATDNCGTAEVTVNDTRTDGNCPNNYIITRIYTATDECGLTNTHIQTITVVDITPPVFVESLPMANLVVECDSVPTPETLTASDTCGSASVTVADVITNGNCDNNYTIARTWTATDECGLTTTHTQIIVVQDTTPPVFVEALPTDILVECDAIPTAETITATDNCGDATVSVTDVRTDGNCPSNYIISRTWTATDECGLTTEHTQTITVQDTTAPVPTSTFDETLNVSCADVPDAPQLEFTDNCSTNVVVVFEETNSFDENVLVDYEIVRTWTVRDACNNEAVYTQTLFVTLDEVITDITAQDRCFDDGIVNLNDFIGDLNTNGVWEIVEGDPAATVTGSIFDPSGLELSQTFLPQDGGIDYRFRYTTTDAGCISITELTMNVNADCVVLPCGENDVVVSKAVTPNGDQFNEFFEVSGVELCGFQYEVKIFNRWGALIFESDNYQNDWNGKALKSIGAASNVPNGTYYYIVILKNSGLNPITGPVYLGTK